MTEPINQYVGDGVTVLYPFTFEYLEPSDIYVSVDQQLNTDWVLTSATEITFNTAPAIGLPINIFRSTDLDSMSAVFAAASTIRARDLNDDFNQLRLAIQEKLNSSTVINEGLPELIQENTDAIQENADAIADLEAQDIVNQIVAGTNITITPTDGKGVVTINSEGGGGGGDSYTLPIASDSVLGGIKVGNNLVIDVNGVLSATGGGGGGGAVDSVNGKVGTVVLNAADVGALPDTTSLDFVPLASWSSIPALP